MASLSRKFLPVFIVSLSFLSILFYSVEVIDRALVPRFFGAASALLLVTTLTYFGLSKTTKLRFDMVTWTYFGYVLCCGISLNYATNESEALFDILLSSIGFIFFLLCIFIFKDRFPEMLKWAKTLTFIAILTLSVSIVYELISLGEIQIKAFRNNEITGLNSNKNLLSSFLFLLLPWFLMRSPNGVEINNKDKVSVIVIIGLILLLGSKASIIALLAAVVMFTLSGKLTIPFLKGSRTQKFVFYVLFTSIIGMAAWFLLAHIMMSQSTLTRFYTWGATWDMIVDHLFEGVGAGNWKVLFPTYWPYEELQMDLTTTIFQHVHNDFLQILAEIGLPGFIFFIAFIASVLIRKSKPEFKKQTSVLKIFLISWFVIVLVDFPLHRVEHLLLFNFMLATLYLGSYSNSKIPSISIPKHAMLLLLIPLLYACLVGYSQYIGEMNTRKLLQARASGQSERVIRLADKALSDAYSLDPTSVPVRWYKGLAQAELGNIEKAKETFGEAIKDHPNAIMVYQDLATAHYVLGNLDMAEQHFMKALALYPDYIDARMNLGFMYLNAGKFANGKEVLKELPARNKIKFLNEVAAQNPPVVHSDSIKVVFYEIQDKGETLNNTIYKLIKSTLIANQLKECLFWQNYLPEGYPGKYNMYFGAYRKAKETDQPAIANQIAAIYRGNDQTDVSFLFSKVRFLIEEKEFKAAAELYNHLPPNEIQHLPFHKSVRQFLLKYELI